MYKHACKKILCAYTIAPLLDDTGRHRGDEQGHEARNFAHDGDDNYSQDSFYSGSEESTWSAVGNTVDNLRKSRFAAQAVSLDEHFPTLPRDLLAAIEHTKNDHLQQNVLACCNQIAMCASSRSLASSL
jgi:hypothetical protein